MDHVPAQPRRIALEGASNLRDLGGLPAADGRRVRSGVVFRSASLARLTAADSATLAGLGLRTEVDFRAADEQARRPSRIADIPGLEHVALPLDPAPGFDLGGLIAAPDTPPGRFLEAMHAAYRAYALECTATYARLFRLLLEPARRPLLFHCTAGKDRTGVAAALLLAALGTPREAIRADYLLTNHDWRGEPEFSAGLPPAARVLLEAHAPLIDATFAAIAAAHGDVATYFHTGLGIDPAALRAALLE